MSQRFFNILRLQLPNNINNLDSNVIIRKTRANVKENDVKFSDRDYFIVNQFNHELDSMDILYAINAKKENRLRQNRPGILPPVTSSHISISDLLDYVNRFFPDVLPESVLKHYNYTERPKGDLGQNILYSERDTDTAAQYEKVNRQLTKENEKLTEDVENLKELLGLQGKETHGKVMKKSSLEAIAKKIMLDSKAKGDVKEFTNILGDVYGYVVHLKMMQILFLLN